MARRKLKPKQEATIERMKENRVNDSIALRKNIEAKLNWAIEERKKGVAVIEKQLAQIKENTVIINKLEGVITALTELLAPEPKEVTEENMTKGATYGG